MTAEELQDQALDELLASKAKQKLDRAEVTRLAGVQSVKQAAKQAADSAAATADLEYRMAMGATFVARNIAEGDDVVAIANANAAFQATMLNHGMIVG